MHYSVSMLRIPALLNCCYGTVHVSVIYYLFYDPETVYGAHFQLRRYERLNNLNTHREKFGNIEFLVLK